MKRSAVKFSVDWIRDGENESAEERSTLCALEIDVGERKVSAYFDLARKNAFDTLLLPAVHLAEGIASNWWKIFGSRDVVHRMLPWRTGFALPDIRLEFDGFQFAVFCEPQQLENPAIIFLQGAREFISRSEAEASLREFVDLVVGKLGDEGVADSQVQLSWKNVLRSLEDTEEQAFCEAAGALGIDPYAISDSDAEFIDAAGALLEGEALIEFLAGVRVNQASLTGDRSTLLRWIEHLRHRYDSCLPDLACVAEEVGDAISGEKSHLPWERGRQAAREFRKVIGLDETRVNSMRVIANKLGGTQFRRKQGPRTVYAVVARQEQSVHIHLRDRGNRKWAKSAETFAFARAVGDAVCFPGTALSTVNSLHRAERQALGRAFAAEVVAPMDSVVDMYEDGRDVDEIAGILQVNPMVVDHQIENSLTGTGSALLAPLPPHH